MRWQVTILLAGVFFHGKLRPMKKTPREDVHSREAETCRKSPRDARMSQGTFFFRRDAQIRKSPPDVFVYISNIDVFVTFVHSQGVKIGTYYIY